MNRTRTGLTPVEFFYTHGEWSYPPDKWETSEQCHRKCAQSLADAEEWARVQGLRFEWQQELHSDRSGIDHTGPLWLCIVWTGRKVVGSLGGIDLGAEGEPFNVPRGRVVEAELSLVAKGA